MADFFLREKRSAHNNFCPQKWTYFQVLDNARHSLTCFGPGGKFLLSLHSPPDLMITNMAVWRRPLSPSASTQRHRRGFCHPQANRLILYLQCHTVGFLPHTQVCHQNLPPVMSHCVAGTDLLRSGVLRPPRRIVD